MFWVMRHAPAIKVMLVLIGVFKRLLFFFFFRCVNWMFKVSWQQKKRLVVNVLHQLPTCSAPQPDIAVNILFMLYV